MTSINGLTNPFENSILNINLTQLEKEQQLANYSDAILQGHEPPANVLAGMVVILASGDLSTEAQARLQELFDLILTEVGPLITSDGGGDTAQVTVDENTSLVTTVTALDQYSLNDGTEILSYSIIGGTDSALFQINTATGELIFNTSPDFEAPIGGDNIYDVDVQVNDGALLLDTQAIQVTVGDVNDNAPVITSGAAIGIDENSTAVTTVTATDADTVGTLSFAIAGGVDSGFFTIDAATGALAFAAAPDFEVPGDAGGDNVYDVMVEVSDGVQSDIQAIQVTVADVNEVPLPLTFGAVLNGIDPGDGSGLSVSSAGDVNGDGFDDMLIGANHADPNGGGSGETYLVYGVASGIPASLDLSSLDGSNGFVMNGIDASDSSGHSVSSAGDVNGDGFDDMLIGADGADPNGRYSGETYLVYGAASGLPASLNLSDLDGSNGFVMNGIDALDFSGRSVSSAGDVNGDGFDDMLIGANQADPHGGQSGETYLVYGAASGIPASLDLSSLNGSNGFVMNGIDAYDYSGPSVSSAGDVNGDGFDDMLIGAFGADPNGNSSGETYLVYGAASGIPASLDLSSLDGSNGFVMNGIDAFDFSGTSVSSAGDVNGDGFDDMLIGASRGDPNGGGSGETYLVYGAASGIPASLDLSSLNGSNGFVMNGIDAYDYSGLSVSSAGDVNGDGFDDMLIGANSADPNGHSSGETYLVYGGESILDTFDLADGVQDGSIELSGVTDAFAV